MRRLVISLSLILFIVLIPAHVLSETIDVLIKGVDDSVKTNKQQDYKEALMNAKLQAIERAGIKIESITRIVNFQMKYKAVESKAKAVLLPGFQVMDLGYQQDGTYQVVLSGKVQVGEKKSALSEREKTFKSLISKSSDALKAGNPKEAHLLAQEALDIPGYKEDSDAKWLLKRALDEIERRRTEKTLIDSSREYTIGKFENFSKTFYHPKNVNIGVKITISGLNDKTWHSPVKYDKWQSGFKKALVTENPVLAQIVFESGGKRSVFDVMADKFECTNWWQSGNDYTRYYSDSKSDIITAKCNDLKITMRVYFRYFEGYNIYRTHYYKVVFMFIDHLKIERTDLKY